MIRGLLAGSLTALIGAAWAISAINVMALDVRTAGDDEIETALQGCWTLENSLEQRSWEKKIELSRAKYGLPPGIPYQASACFGEDGAVNSGWVGGDEGIEAVGTFQVSDGKLRLRTPQPWDGWIFGATNLDCDLLMSPGRAMKLMNCKGVGEDVSVSIPDSSFGFMHGDD